MRVATLPILGGSAILAWVFAYHVLFGSGAQFEKGVVVMPSQELCEAVRRSILTMPAVDHGAIVANDCKERTTAAEPARSTESATRSGGRVSAAP